MDRYALERCGRPGRWAADARALARRVSKLPKVRAALWAGRISWCMADVVCRRATPETEDAVLKEALTCTVRQVQTKFPPVRPVDAEAPGDDVVVQRRVLTTTVPAGDAWALEYARKIVAAMNAGTSDEAVAYALLAEGQTTLENLVSFDLEAASPDRGELRRAAEYRAQRAAWQREAEEMVEDALAREVDAITPAPETEMPTTPRALDTLIRSLSADLASRDAVLGELSRRFFDASGWRRMGYASESQYARERAGCSLSSLRARITLSRRMADLPALARALAKGEIPYTSASLAARVATPGTADAWLARARERTVRHLGEEVEALEMLARAGGDPGVVDDGPPDDDLFEATVEIERKVLSGRVFQISGGPVPEKRQEKAVPSEEDLDDVSRRLRPAAGHVTVKLRVTEETFFLWRALERQFRRCGIGGSFVAFLAHTFVATWGHLYREHNPANRKVLLRDVFRCTNPVCGIRIVEDHHIVYLSHGGSNELSNRTALCPVCHHHLVHEGRVHAEPPAPRVKWRIGRDPILTVDGRRAMRI